MKNSLQFIRTLLFTLLIIYSCTDSESIYVATPPADGQLLINPSATNILLTKAKKNETAVSFSWDSPDFGVATPKQYTIQFDSANGDFSSPETVTTTTRTASFTHQTLNAIAGSKNLEFNKEGQLKVRLKTSLNYGSLPTYSKVETITVTPYEDLFFPLPLSGTLYLQGDAVPSNWGYPVADSQKLTRVAGKPIFTITTQLIGGKKFALISGNMGWGNPAYVALDASQAPNGGSFTENGSNTTPPWTGTPFTAPTNTGTYVITVDFATGKYTVVPQ